MQRYIFPAADAAAVAVDCCATKERHASSYVSSHCFYHCCTRPQQAHTLTSVPDTSLPLLQLLLLAPAPMQLQRTSTCSQSSRCSSGSSSRKLRNRPQLFRLSDSSLQPTNQSHKSMFHAIHHPCAPSLISSTIQHHAAIPTITQSHLPARHDTDTESPSNHRQCAT